MKERLTREQFLAKQEKRRMEKKETRNFVLGLIALTAMSYASIWIASAIAFVN